MVRVVPHDPAWPQQAQQEIRELQQVLQDLDLKVHHIGSTSILRIHAKPVLDFLLECPSLEELDDRSSRVEDLGYKAKGEFGIPGRRFFLKNDASGRRTHHVHAFETGSPGAQRHLAFRDYLIAHPGLAAEYSELKQALARRFPDDIESYMDGKDPFIKRVEAEALAWAANLRN